jgi:hypothetical protein
MHVAVDEPGHDTTARQVILGDVKLRRQQGKADADPENTLTSDQKFAKTDLVRSL